MELLIGPLMWSTLVTNGTFLSPELRSFWPAPRIESSGGGQDNAQPLFSFKFLWLRRKPKVRDSRTSCFRTLPELSICGAGQRGRSSGDENVNEINLCGFQWSWRVPRNVATGLIYSVLEVSPSSSKIRQVLVQVQF